MKRYSVVLVASLAVGMLGCERSPDGLTGSPMNAVRAAQDKTIGVNVLLSGAPTQAQLTELGAYGRVSGKLIEINAVFMKAATSALPAIRALPYVLAAEPDAERHGAPVDAVGVTDFANGFNTWDLDAINVTDLGAGRTIAYDGSGVYVGVLDTGLLDSWRQYFPEERIAEEYGIAFGGGGGEQGNVSTQPNKWEHDQNSHGTHVTSTILGYQLGVNRINGTAPRATVIPVKVLNQNGSGWSSVVAEGIVYITNLKRGPLAAHPVVINMSLGGPVLDAVEKAAIDYAVSNGVIIVASAGNGGNAGMGFPGAYAPVISVAASGWIGEWRPAGNGGWWNNRQVADPTAASDFYITTFSARARTGQDLDVAAPGSWVVGPYQLQSGSVSYFFLGGTSMASPHVAGIVAMMLQKNPSLTAAQAEDILTSTAIDMSGDEDDADSRCRTVFGPTGTSSRICWPTTATGSGLATADAALAATP